MSLFFGKKSGGPSCGCAASARDADKTAPTSNAGIKVLGSGCAKCRSLEENVRAAMRELALEEAIDHVTDYSSIAAYGVMSTPALVVDGKVASFGRVLSKDEAKALIARVRGL